MARQLQQQIAQEAARLMVLDQVTSIPVAKQKAMQRLGIQNKRLMPDNQEVEAALIQYQRLFSSQQSQLIQMMRTSAHNAMCLLQDFTPRLVGPVLRGTATKNDAISLHVFTDTPEELHFFLVEHGIPYTTEEHDYQQSRDKVISCPACRFLAGQYEISITIFPYHALRQAPLSPIDDKPMKRADINAVKKLIAAE